MNSSELLPQRCLLLLKVLARLGERLAQLRGELLRSLPLTRLDTGDGGGLPSQLGQLLEKFIIR